ncbi:hypothetical protein IF188_09590 [Microbacterium sp. NEAU-LLC]|uniref:Uncharacterized protein n=1 Tax=Microbacterium helvum TaxID=2773713 RepID=A0ABR8NQV0_9MICO|nr:hypothetical protein [Microbacterium helvum]MBD3941946.1 hypothetical protein [Microbacterium helvum]
MSCDGQKAHGILLGYAPLSRHGACWYYVWQACAAAGATTGMSALPTAYKAWEASSGKHPGDRNPPPGALIWLGRRFSDGNMDGDVFIAGGINGDQSAATDYPTWGSTGLVSIQGRIDQTGREYLGWTDHVLDCPITLGGDEMSAEAEKQINEIYNAIFFGGPSMPDGTKSVGQSLADIAAGRRPVVVRSEGEPTSVATEGENTWIQELADIKTLQLQLNEKIDALAKSGPGKGE